MNTQSQAIPLCYVTPLQLKILKNFSSSYTTSKALSLRSEIILFALQKLNFEIAKLLEITRKTVSKWINRWLNFSSKFSNVTDECKLKKLIAECLSDSYRSGKPSKFTAEEVTRIFHLACTAPRSINIPLSHWSTRSLAQYLTENKIVKKISHERVAFFLRKAHLQPHRSRYWLNSRTRNSTDYDTRIKDICFLYKNAIQMHQEGVHIVSIDEKTGIQAIDRADPNLPMKSNSPEKKEHEYVRHGTQCLIANLEIGTGKIIAPMVSSNRKNNDFLSNIKNLIALDPDAEWIFVADQLNTHKSEGLVKFIAQEINFEGDLGKTGHHGSGILKSMVTRMSFLENKSHRIRFQFTPKHCSWMNQIEIWFGILVRKLLRRGNFTSTDALKTRILEFVEYFNRTMAKPFKWTYKGKPLCN